MNAVRGTPTASRTWLGLTTRSASNGGDAALSKTRDALKVPVYQPRGWGVPRKGKALPGPWWGLDTERNTEPGPRFNDLVCAFISNETESHAFRALDDLEAGTYWVWNVGYDIERLVADLGIEEGWAMKQDGTPFLFNGAKCVYYQGKRFEYAKDGKKRVFLEASSFFNRISLKEAAKSLCTCACPGCAKHKKEPVKFQHCGSDPICPMKDPVDASKMSLTRYENDSRYRRIVDEYCAKDARIAYRLIAFLAQGFKDLNVDIGGTPGSTARRFLSDMPAFPKVIWTTHRAFLSAYCGGRFEITRRGVFGDAKQYDKVSAYPWALSKCPMLTPHATSQFTRRLSDNALYGAYEVSFETDEYLGLMPGWRGMTRIYSKAETSGWLCKPELDWLQRNGYDFKIHRGVEIFDEAATDGWRDLILPLFHKKDGHAESCPIYHKGVCGCRRDLKGKPASLGAKVGVNSMYGILIQLIKKGGQWVPIEEAKHAVDFAGSLALEKGPPAFEAGQFYAPCYSSTLTSMVRVDLLDTARKAGEENVVAFHTDSILLKDGGSMPVGRELGDWSLEKEADELIILKSGQYAIGETVKGRGFSKRKLNPESEDEIAVRQKIDLWATKHTRRGRVSVKTAKSWRDVSAIRDKQVANNIGWEVKRNWDRGFDARMIARKEWVDSTALSFTMK